MGYTDTILDQARAKLDAGETAAAWELTTAIAKAEPENVRAWELMADIVAPVSPERAARYREKARAAAGHAPAPTPQPGAAQTPYQASPAKLQLGQDIAQAEGDLALHQKNLRDLERQLASTRSRRTGGAVVFFIGLFCLFLFFGVWLLWVVMMIASAMAWASAGTRIEAIEKNIRAAEAAITDIQQQLARLRMQFSLMA